MPVAKFAAKIRGSSLKTENGWKKDTDAFWRQRKGDFVRIRNKEILQKMKKLLLFLMLATATVSCHKSNDNNSSINASAVPGTITSSFNTRYPSASGQIEWEKEDGNTYKVKFFQGAQRWQAIFAADGSFLSEKQI